MIITISGADFSLSNIGTLSTWTVSKSIGAGAEHNIPSYVDKNSAFNYEITLKDGYTFGTYSVTMGGQTITPTVTETSMTINIASVTGAIRIEVKTINSSTGEPEEPEEPGTGGGSDTPTYIETTIGSTNYPTKIVPSWEYVDLTINGIISTGGGSNCTINTTSSGRCSNIDYVLQVNGGETISFAPTSLVGSWALTEFKDIPLTKNNFTPNGDASKSWLTGNATLQTATKYIIMNFKKADSGDFTKENIADIKNTITIN